MMVMMEVFLTCILIEHDFNTLSVNMIFGVQFFSFLVNLSYLSNILLFLYHLKFLFSRLFFLTLERKTFQSKIGKLETTRQKKDIPDCTKIKKKLFLNGKIDFEWQNTIRLK